MGPVKLCGRSCRAEMALRSPASDFFGKTAGPAARHLAGARSANKPLRASKVSGSRHPL